MSGVSNHLGARRSPVGFTEDDFSFIAQLAKRKFGLNLSETKMPLVHSRVSRRMRELNLSEFSAYRRLLENEKGTQEEKNLLSVLTTNVTSFFRENHHFDHLGPAIAERVKQNAASARPIRIWSAACSTGQEAYSIAMIVASVCSPDQFKRIELIASDIDPLVVETARQGIYPMSELKSIPTALARLYTTQISGSEFQIAKSLTEQIEFKQINLIDRFPAHASYDFVFCRNVAIYFAQDTQAKVWNSFANALRPGGILYIGHSERIHGEAAGKLKNCGITIYSRV